MFPDLFTDDVFTLETGRLLLRWPTIADVSALVAEAGDRRIAEMTATIPHPYGRADAERFVAAVRAGNAAGEKVALAITLTRAPAKLIGAVGLHIRPEGEIALGYWLGLAHWGRGYVTEAAQALIDAAFLYSEVPAIVAGVRVINPASRKVLEHCGFQFEGSIMLPRPVWGDTVPADTYRLTRATWASLKGWRAPLPTFRETAGL